MKIVLGILMLAASATLALAAPPPGGAPAPELAAGLPGLLSVAGVFAASRIWRRRAK